MRTFSGPLIEGHATERFAGVAEAFRRRFEAGEELGAALCVYHAGAPVVDLWGGRRGPGASEAWDRETAVPVMSTSKGVTAAVIHLLVERRQLTTSERVSDHWPEFAGAGKADITLSEVLSHTASVPALDWKLGYEDVRHRAVLHAAIEAQAPQWPPGRRAGYHPLTGGWIMAEVARRATGRSLGDLLRAEIAGPLGLNLSLSPHGLSGGLARLEFPITREAPPELADLYAAFADPQSLTARAFGNPSFAPWDMNTVELQELEIPSGGALADARSLARLYAALVSRAGDGLWSPETVASATALRASGADEVLRCRTDYAEGFMRPGGPMFPEAPADAFGHGGSGGSLAFAWPAAGIAFAYVMNRMSSGPGAGSRTKAITQALYAALR